MALEDLLIAEAARITDVIGSKSASASMPRRAICACTLRRCSFRFSLWSSGSMAPCLPRSSLAFGARADFPSELDDAVGVAGQAYAALGRDQHVGRSFQ